MCLFGMNKFAKMILLSIGWMYDVMASYGPAFIMAGVMIAISGVVMFAIPPIQRYKERQVIGNVTQQVPFRSS